MPAKPDKDGAPAPLMEPSEMKPLLRLSRRRLVACAVALTKGRQAVILLHRRLKPRKLLAELKSQARAGGIQLNTGSVRFGRVRVDGASDSQQALFTLNKAAAGGMRMAALALLRPAGYQRCEFVVDAALEDEGEDGEDRFPEDDEADAEGRAKAGGDEPGGGARPSGMPTPAPPVTADLQSPADPSMPDSPAAGVAGMQPDAGPAGGGGQEVAGRLTALVRRVAALPGGLARAADELRAAAVQGHQALKAGDLAGAAQAADALEALLGRPAGGRAAGMSATSGPRPAGSTDGAPAPGAGPTASPAPSAASGDGKAKAQVLFGKGRQAWLAVCARMEADIGKVLGELEAHYGGEDARVQAIRARVEPVLHRFDDSLGVALAAASDADAPDARAAALGAVQDLLGRYRAWVDGEPMLVALDHNPFHPMAARQTLDAVLAALGKAVVGAR